MTNQKLVGVLSRNFVMYDSPEAAQFRTGLSGWVSRDGRFWGDDEHMARYCGATHRKCEGNGCDQVISLRARSLCSTCEAAAAAARWEQMPQEEWDGVCMLASYRSDYFFRDTDEIVQHCLDHDIEAVRSLQLVLTEPNLMHEFDPSDFMHDSLPEDMSFDDVAPAAVVAALDALNQAIRDHASHALSWSPGQTRVTDAFIDGVQQELDHERRDDPSRIGASA